MRLFLIILILVFITGCGHKTLPVVHLGQPFICQNITEPGDIEKNKKAYIRQKNPIKIQGNIKYFDKVLGQWAFIENNGSLIFVDFANTTPNMSLPRKRTSEEIFVEGNIFSDDTVLNGYILKPYALEFINKSAK